MGSDWLCHFIGECVMAKHIPAADAVLKGQNFGYLDRFKNRKFLEQGHNTLEDCFKKCEKLASPIRRRACENKCAIEG